jgi:peptidyl-prolyl cis-trans isomerase C
VQGLPQQVTNGEYVTTLALLLVSALTASAAGAGQRPVPSHAVSPSARPPVREVARVNGTALMSDRLDAAVGALIPMESFHRNVSAEKMATLRRQALQSMVDEELQFQEAGRLGITVLDADVEAAWKRAAARYGGAKGFEEALRQSGATPAAARAELRRSLAIAAIAAREVAAKCVVTAADAASFFAAHPERFIEPEQLHIFAITVGVDPSSGPAQWAAAKARAAEALRELKGGAPFAAMVLKYSTDSSKATGGDMGLVHRGSLSERFEQVAKTLPVGQISDVVETLYGYHIIRVSEIRPAQKKSLTEVSTSLQKDLTVQRCGERKDVWLAGLRARASVAIAAQAP